MNVYDRAQACILHLLRQAEGEGHTFTPEKIILEHVSRRYEIDIRTAEESLEDLSNAGDVVIGIFTDDSDERAVYLKPIWQAEHGIANRIFALLSVPVNRCRYR